MPFEETLTDTITDDDLEYFYVGVTVDPIRRWIGGMKRGSYMPGHRLPEHAGGKACTEMHVFALLPGYEARSVEARLIKFARSNYPQLCRNVAEDARGICLGQPNFVYIVLRNRLLRW